MLIERKKTKNLILDLERKKPKNIMLLEWKKTKDLLLVLERKRTKSSDHIATVCWVYSLEHLWTVNKPTTTTTETQCSLLSSLIKQ